MILLVGLNNNSCSSPFACYSLMVNFILSLRTFTPRGYMQKDPGLTSSVSMLILPRVDRIDLFISFYFEILCRFGI